MCEVSARVLRRELALIAVLAAATSCGRREPPPVRPTCFANWRTVYASAPNELVPARGDLAWQAGTLYVGHSGTEYAWIFSMSDHGGAKNPLYEGHVRGYWLEDQRLLYAQNHVLFDMPRTGGPPTEVLHFGDRPADPSNGDSLFDHTLDRTAIYWLYADTSGVPGAVSVWRHLRGGVDDTNLATVPSTETHLRPLRWAEQAKGKLVLSFEPATVGDSAGQPYAATVSKADGTLTPLATDGLNSTLLAASSDGALLWSRRDRFAYDGGPVPASAYSFAQADIGGAAPSDLTSAIPPAAVPLDAWAAGDHAWYVATSELDANGAAYLSIWYLTPAGAATRLACDPVSGTPTTTGVSPSSITAGVVADGSFYASVLRPDGTWSVAAADNPGAHADTGDPGDSGDAGVSTGTGGATGSDGAACPALPASGDAGGAGPVLTEFLIPGPSSGATRIATGPDGALYFGESGKNAMGRITTDGCMTEIPLRTAPSDIIVGPDRYLWFSQPGTPQIGRVLQDGSLLREFSVAPAGSPSEITFGADGSLWFGATGPNGLVRLTTGGTVTVYPTTNVSNPRSVVAAPDGKIWFTDGTEHAVGHIDPATGIITSLPVPNDGAPSAMELGPDGNLWAIETRDNGLPPALLRVTTSGTFTEFPLAAGSGPVALCAGPDGNIWFAENGTAQIARLVPASGALTEFPVTVVDPGLTGITAGPDGNIWFVESGANRIGRLVPE